MSLRKRLRVLFVCFILQTGPIAWEPMRPDETQQLMHQMNQPKLAHVLRAEDRGQDLRMGGFAVF